MLQCHCSKWHGTLEAANLKATAITLTGQGEISSFWNKCVLTALMELRIYQDNGCFTFFTVRGFRSWEPITFNPTWLDASHVQLLSEFIFRHQHPSCDSTILSWWLDKLQWSLFPLRSNYHDLGQCWGNQDGLDFGIFFNLVSLYDLICNERFVWHLFLSLCRNTVRLRVETLHQCTALKSITRFRVWYRGRWWGILSHGLEATMQHR